MNVKTVKKEWFQDYKVPSMLIAAAGCTFKCEKESGVRCCQNSDLAKAETLSINNGDIVRMYLSNSITSAIIFAGLEPFDQFEEMLEIIRLVRHECDDDVVIYTGYNKEELTSQIGKLSQFKNIIIKFGRFKPGQTPHYDSVLGVKLASDNQYAEKIS